LWNYQLDHRTRKTMLDIRLSRTLTVTPDHLTQFHAALASLAGQDRLLVNPAAIDGFIARSDDTYLWHTESGATWRESPLLRTRMDEAGIPRQARLAHGALGLTHALRVASLQQPERPILGVEGIRYLAPVFDGATITASIEPDGAFSVSTDQLEPNTAIAGHIMYGAVGTAWDADQFSSTAEQQLFSLEEAIGVVSALIGLSVQAAGGRVLYMGQQLQLQGLLSPGDELAVQAEIVDRQPGKRMGERTTATVRASHSGGEPIAAGESIFLYLELAGLA